MAGQECYEVDIRRGGSGGTAGLDRDAWPSSVSELVDQELADALDEHLASASTTDSYQARLVRRFEKHAPRWADAFPVLRTSAGEYLSTDDLKKLSEVWLAVVPIGSWDDPIDPTPSLMSYASAASHPFVLFPFDGVVTSTRLEQILGFLDPIYVKRVTDRVYVVRYVKRDASKPKRRGPSYVAFAPGSSELKIEGPDEKLLINLSHPLVSEIDRVSDQRPDIARRIRAELEKRWFQEGTLPDVVQAAASEIESDVLCVAAEMMASKTTYRRWGDDLVVDLDLVKQI